MSTYNINKYKKIFISASALVFIFGFFFYTEDVASASTNNGELWVEATVEAKGSINVYATPDSRSYSRGLQTDGSRGVIIEGPSNNLQTGVPGMFKVDFASGFDGWTHDTGLILIPPTCDSFTVYPTTLPANGGTVTLNWNTTNATFVGISPTVGEVLADDSVNVNVTSDTTYTLEAANSSGSDYCSVSIDVTTNTSDEPSATSTDRQTMINYLTEQLNYLKTMLLAEYSGHGDVLKVGTEVATTDYLRIRSVPSITGQFLGIQRPDSKGVIVEGPVTADGYQWFKVDYESGTDGWNVASWLRLWVNASTNPNTATYTKYSQDDVSSVTKTVIGNTSLGKEVTTYTITLKNGKLYQVVIPLRMQPSVVVATFRATGYTGDVNKLRAMAGTDVPPITTLLPTCDSFTVYPTTLPSSGGTVTLNWNTTNATFVGISPTVGEVLADDSVNVNVTSDTTYTLEAANSSGSSYCSVNVDVITTTPSTVCTADVMTCSDGSQVGRSGPSCDFICPAPSLVEEVMARIVINRAFASSSDLNSKKILVNDTTINSGDWFPLTKNGERILDARTPLTVSGANTFPGLIVTRQSTGVNVYSIGRHESIKSFEITDGYLEIKNTTLKADSLKKIQFENHASSTVYDHVERSSDTKYTFGMFVDVDFDGFVINYTDPTYSPVPAIEPGVVLGASTDIWDQIGLTLTNISKAMKDLINNK